jgi:hypothetical protein
MYGNVPSQYDVVQGVQQEDAIVAAQSAVLGVRPYE